MLSCCFKTLAWDSVKREEKVGIIVYAHHQRYILALSCSIHAWIQSFLRKFYKDNSRKCDQGKSTTKFYQSLSTRRVFRFTLLGLSRIKATMAIRPRLSQGERCIDFWMLLLSLLLGLSPMKVGAPNCLRASSFTFLLILLLWWLLILRIFRPNYVRKTLFKKHSPSMKCCQGEIRAKGSQDWKKTSQNYLYTQNYYTFFVNISIRCTCTTERSLFKHFSCQKGEGLEARKRKKKILKTVISISCIYRNRLIQEILVPKKQQCSSTPTLTHIPNLNSANSKS